MVAKIFPDFAAKIKTDQKNTVVFLATLINLPRLEI